MTVKFHQDINFKELAKIDFIQNWTGQWSILSCCIFGERNTVVFSKYLGACFNKTVFICKKGFSSCYLEKQDSARLGNYLANKVVKDNRIALKWCQELKKQTDHLRAVMEKLYGKHPSLKEYRQFRQALYDYAAPHSAVKQIVNYLPENLLKKYLPKFSKARKYSEKIYDEMEDFMNKLSKAMSKQVNLNPKYILCMIEQEFEDYLKTSQLIDKNILRKRFIQSALIYEKTGYNLICGSKVSKLEKILKKVGEANEIKGRTAYKGCAKGKVRIVLNPQSVKEFSNGDILVAGMTRPDFVPLIKKAGAIVTDGGGVLCHAAIIARELKKPCVIATLNATKLLKNGDLVEVDAKNGLVRKI